MNTYLHNKNFIWIVKVPLRFEVNKQITGINTNSPITHALLNNFN